MAIAKNSVGMANELILFCAGPGSSLEIDDIYWYFDWHCEKLAI